MPTYTVSPEGWLTFFGNDGLIVPGGKLFTYAAGTTTKLTTYTDSAGSGSNTNPIILDSAGRCVVFLQPTAYKFVLAPSTDTDPPTNPIKTQDNISAVPVTNVNLDVDGTAGESLTANDAVYLSDGSGGATAGRWYKTDADFTYSSIDATSIGLVVATVASGEAASIRLQGRSTGLSGLTAGTDYYVSATAGALTSSAPTNSRKVGRADSTTSIIIGPAYPPMASGSIPGLVSTAAQTFAGAKTFSSAAIFGALPTGFGMPVMSRLTSTFTKTSDASYTDVTGLSFAVGANETWIFAFYLSIIAPATGTAGLSFKLTGPAAPTSVRYSLSDVSSGAYNRSSAAFGTAVSVLGSADVDSGTVLYGIVRNGSNAGTVQLQAAQITSTGTSSKVYVDSFVISQKMA